MLSRKQLNDFPDESWTLFASWTIEKRSGRFDLQPSTFSLYVFDPDIM